MRTTLIAAALLAAVAAPPAHAEEILVNARAAHEVEPDGTACFDLYMGGPITGVAAIVTAVRTERPRPVAELLYRGGFQPPTDYHSAYTPFATTHDSARVCVPGVGYQIVGGSSYATVVANGSAAGVVIVLRCTYTRAGPTCV